MTKQQLLDLAERVEGLSGPCRETDAMIAHAIAWRWDGWGDGDVEIECRTLESVIDRTFNSHNSIFKLLPAYTASLDAAMQLVPKGWCMTVADYWCEGDAKPPYFADCGDLTALKAGVDGVIVQAWATNPALALTSASLRAKASMMEDE